MYMFIKYFHTSYDQPKDLHHLLKYITDFLNYIHQYTKVFSYFQQIVRLSFGETNIRTDIVYMALKI